ncbi:DUF393 domain-containing protein [Corticibacter populi]|uniref:DUF393 domain-containing protein n=1 Tax=Corticibacter populi TaxID=1550736 RepID=A0A3M6R004_9BURK|nr:DUF393 domain-containing protein [Corticibacter populi]RMX08590.1 DUF393 domain-containing protein [Corticibacter populi]RZS35914.1 putative DCC family thiol-disulfide oxidoreductase YuxK [Corticibacter populi]
MSDTVAFPLTIFYDRSCRLCRSEMHNLKLRDQADRLRLVDASQAEQLAGLALGVPQQELLALIHARDAQGRWLRGVAVFEAAYAAAGLDWVARPLRWPVVGPLARRLYPWVARHRNRFPQWLAWLLFEQASRRAARRAVARSRCDAGQCGL